MNKILLSISITINIILIGIAIALMLSPVCWEYSYGEDGGYIFICQGGKK